MWSYHLQITSVFPTPIPTLQKKKQMVGEGHLKKKQLKLYLGSSVPPSQVTLLISILQPAS